MRHLITCALNGLDLLALDDRIYIEDILEEIEIDHETGKRAAYGLFPLNEPRHQNITLTVKVMVKERRRPERMSVIQDIRAWAGRGWLTTNIRPNQRLYVFCVQPPNAETFDWTGRMEIVFRAYGESYWQDVRPRTASSETAVTSANVTLSPTGTRPCFLEAEITPSGDMLTTARITVNGDRFFQLNGLEIGAGETLAMYYDELHLLHIECDGASLLGSRTAESADHLTLTPKQPNTIALSFNTACDYTIKARGMWR